MITYGRDFEILKGRDMTKLAQMIRDKAILVIIYGWDFNKICGTGGKIQGVTVKTGTLVTIARRVTVSARFDKILQYTTRHQRSHRDITTSPGLGHTLYTHKIYTASHLNNSINLCQYSMHIHLHKFILRISHIHPHT